MQRKISKTEKKESGKVKEAPVLVLLLSLRIPAIRSRKVSDCHFSGTRYLVFNSSIFDFVFLAGTSIGATKVRRERSLNKIDGVDSDLQYLQKGETGDSQHSTRYRII